ncbi:hypothetical protein KC921_00900 [Candidatus Woesebacteria bacterium]|nr:hypothetical protein [Candidatus Woesebacteria bacterium]
MLIEQYDAPEHYGHGQALGLIAQAISANLCEYEYTGSWHAASHLGVVDSLSIVPQLTQKYRLYAVHLSCQSDKHPLAYDGSKQYRIWCMIFTEKNSDYQLYHLSYLTEESLTLEQFLDQLDQSLESAQLEVPLWVQRSVSTAVCQ